jgi:hypothetical protein
MGFQNWHLRYQAKLNALNFLGELILGVTALNFSSNTLNLFMYAILSKSYFQIIQHTLKDLCPGGENFINENKMVIVNPLVNYSIKYKQLVMERKPKVLHLED